MTNDKTSPDVSSDDKLWAALAYAIPFWPILIMLLENKRDRPYIRSHNVQALVLGLFISIVLGPFTLGCGYIAWFGMLFLAFKAYNGEEITIPVITDFVKKQGWA